ncbi:hypothetical protein VP01_4934g1 [Puccinia sorghi]|uniref:Uncharacterized protein n=1 Tax=Puccinia sorghi TaxID=27349 RepID=A0A0L6UP04_9BASI|nr:hypothetical protein VP01_4934g1 [Puccinia sorghi]
MHSILRMIEAGTAGGPLTPFPDFPGVSEAVRCNQDELDCWMLDVQTTGCMFLKGATGLMGSGKHKKIIIFNSTSFYLNIYREWCFEVLGNIKEHCCGLDMIREAQSFVFDQDRLL